jgi:hypothetical protein
MGYLQEVVYAVFAGAKNGDWCGAFFSDTNDVDITGAMYVYNDG